MVDARLPAPWSPGEGLPARRAWKGRLLGVGEDSFTIAPALVDAEGEIVPERLPEAVIPMDRCRRVSRIPIFVRPAKPGKKPKRRPEAPQDMPDQSSCH